ncbi:S-layer homology domain-containing protein [Paenibacillus sp. UMB4589-SE434]|uniref:S-layer homology domain-containing protein n=1 Tax=Paenibacillus sp. UMB4589-SE434 TaxID=3046314 RepID=UPI00254DF3AE|nr:S-layer homology domain-containing protein [Paenibacillus sp. UMB4589-SE434]MDK8181614.1 S-layer homology domain-containing protein [Paenibacillus sp. UMB4589-SE434]
MREMSYESSEKHSQQPKQFRGGEKKVMKKRLALLLSVAMAFSMFANVAFGAENTLTTAQKYDELVKAGIFSGFPGQTDPQLNTLTDRAQFAKILALVAGLDQAEGNSFKDQNYGKHWAKGYIEAVVKAGYMNGVGNSKFDLKGKVTGEQMAKSFALALGLKEVADAPAADGVTKWATGWVAAIKAAGFDFSVNGKWNVPAPRSVLVEAAYDIKAKNGVKVESAVALDEKTVEVTFSDKEKEKVTLDKALVEGQETTVSVTHKGKKYDVKVTLGALSIQGKATGASTFEVKLNRTIDTAAAKWTVKRGSTEVAIAKDGIKFSDDKLTAQVTTNNKLSEGEYTVNLTSGDKTVSATVKVDAEKVTKIELLGDKASVNEKYTEIKVGFKVVNQYGEDASKLADIQWTVSKSDNTSPTVDTKNGLVTFKTTENNKYFYNEPVAIMVYDKNTGVVANKTFNVGTPAKATTVEFKDVYNIDGKTLSSTTDTSKDEFYILVNLKDQYGNVINDTYVPDNALVTSSNPMIMGAEDKLVTKKGPKGDSVAIKLKSPDQAVFRQSGEVNINVITFGNGQTSTHKLSVTQGAELKSFKMFKPETDVAFGDDAVTIPFEATDANGEAIKTYKDLKKAYDNKVLSFNLQSAELYFTEDVKTNAAVLKYKVAATGSKTTVMLYSTVAKYGNTNSISFDVKEVAKPVAVKGFIKDIETSYGLGAQLKLNEKSFNFVDQYNRTMDYDKVKANYQVGIVNVDAIKANSFFGTQAEKAALSANNHQILDATGVSLTAQARGEFNVEVALFDKATGAKINNSEATVRVSAVTVDNISSYEVKELGSLYVGKNNIWTGSTVSTEVYKDLEVFGKRGNGEKVKLSPTDYNVTVDSNYIKVDGNSKLTPAANVDDALGQRGTVELTVKVNIKSAELTPATVDAKLTVSNMPQQVKSVFADDDKVAFDITRTGNVLNVNDLLTKVKGKDQYGLKDFLSKITGSKTVTTFVSKVIDQHGDVVSLPQIVGNGSTNTVVNGLEVGAKVYVTVSVDGAQSNFIINVK